MAADSERISGGNDQDLSSAEESGTESGSESSSATSTGWHPVWKSFEKFIASDGQKKARCLEKKRNGKPCTVSPLSGWYSSAAMRHLKAVHPEAFKTRKGERKARKSEREKKKCVRTGQQELQYMKLSAKYLPEHPKQKMVTRKLAKAFVANSLPARLIENDDFREALTALDDKYDSPSRYLLLQEEKLMFETMRNSVMSLLQKATKVAITADIWTKRGGSESFFGITAHWYNRRSHQRMMATLAIRNLPETHNARAVYNQTCRVLESWSIPLSKVSKVVTDNGSNMVKAFQESFQLVNAQDAELLADHSDEFDDLNTDSAILDPNLDESFIEPSDADIDSEIIDFDVEEQQIELAFEKLERLSCFAHSLQCCIRILDKSSFVAPSRKAAFILINSFSHSAKATQLLIQKKNKKLLTACKTRWSYNCLALERLLDLRTAVTEITSELQTIDNLTNSQWLDIERYVKFMKPFANATYSVEGNQYATLSEVIPHLLELVNHLEEARNINGYKAAAVQLLTEIKQRFSYITDPSHYKFEPSYITATALDPRFRLVLDEPQTNAAKREILNLLAIQSVQPSAVVVEGNHALTGCWSENIGQYNYVLALIKQKQQAQEEIQHNPAGEELASYFGSNHILALVEDPLEFWTDHAVGYPRLATLSQDILTIPATSAPVERLFSQASIAISGRRNRLSGQQLEQEVMLKTNKVFF